MPTNPHMFAKRTLFCPTLGREYHLSVALPDSYRTSTQAYLVIYVLDGDLRFGMAAGLTPIARWCLGVAEVIIVGISYGMESYDQWVHLRERDFKIPEVRVWAARNELSHRSGDDHRSLQTAVRTDAALYCIALEQSDEALLTVDRMTRMHTIG